MGYLNFSVEDLLTDESFQQYCAGTNEASVQYWTKILEDNPHLVPTFNEALRLFEMLNATQGNLSEQSDRLLKRINATIEGAEKGSTNKKRLYRTWWAAAVVLLVFATTAFFLGRRSKTELANNTKLQKVQTAIVAGNNKAVLTLADGSQIVLDTASNGAVTKQAGVTIIKLDGKLDYKKGGTEQGEVFYNTVSTPRGGQYQVILADGTKVWLNAASSLRFPTAFAGEERVVELTGEGYFEVAHNAAIPFHVKVGDMDVQVLGTHFNVMAYSNEELVKTTLLEGKVKIKKASAITLLLPGQQAQVNSTGEMKVDKNADVQAAVAWKNGLFQLKGADVKAIGRQIERWYDVEVDYDGNVQSAHLSGEVPRTLHLSEVIKVLEASGIAVKLTGRHMLVAPRP